MARIPDVEIERLKKEVPVERLVMGFGVELKRHEAELIGTCPFHEDRTPSLVVSPKTNLWHCLGAFNIGGSTIDWANMTGLCRCGCGSGGWRGIITSCMIRLRRLSCRARRNGCRKRF
ncbi:MAG: hypothetical protein JNM66_01095 [Bryobacterales bacterium]|nr:hypothetical protein [Bryobacterales bacterium]